MAEYRNDLAWDYLSNLYSASPANATLQDLYYRWMVDNNLSYGDLGGFFTTATGIANAGDAEFKYWKDAPFSPLDLAPALWLDAADATTITASSGAVSEWRDKSGNARHVSQGTAAAQPTTGASTLNGLNVLSFDAGDVLRAADSAALRTASMTVFAVVTLPAAPLSGIKSVMANGNAASFSTNNYILGITGASMAVLGRTPQAVVSGSALSPSTSYVLEWVHSGSAVTARANGTLNINAAASTLGTDNTTGTSVGNASGAAYPWTDGKIAEIVQYGSELSASDLTKVRNYLTTKWGL